MTTLQAPMARRWYSFGNVVPGETEIAIYGEIGGGWTGDGISARQFRNELAGVATPRITVRINSEGGDVFDGFDIYNSLQEHPAHVTTRITGLAASIASVIAMAGDEIHIARNGFLMIHQASGLVMGTADDMEKNMVALRKIDGKIAAVYAARSGRPLDEVRGWMQAETWYTAEEALAAGLATRVLGESAEMPQRVAACLTRFHNVPMRIKTMKNETPGQGSSEAGTAAPTTFSLVGKYGQRAAVEVEPENEIVVCRLPDEKKVMIGRDLCEKLGGTVVPQEPGATPAAAFSVSRRYGRARPAPTAQKPSPHATEPRSLVPIMAGAVRKQNLSAQLVDAADAIEAELSGRR